MRPVSRLTTGLTLGLVACSGTPANPPNDSAAPACEPVEPHVVLVILDDVGWTGLSGGQTSEGHGSDFHETPRLDALADQGVAFSAAYASPQCQPARAAILTGLHAAHTGMYANFDANRADPALRQFDAPPTLERLPLDVLTLAERLGPIGYRTAHIGKWHIGVHGADGPEEQGFDLNIGGTDKGSISGGLDGHFARADGAFIGLPGLGPNGVANQFAADRITDDALTWLDTEPTEPSLLVLSHWSVHTPIQAPESEVAHFEGKDPGTLHSEPIYAGMLRNLDANVGRVVDHLEQTPDVRTTCDDRLIDNTLLVVLSDNGGVGGFASEGVQTSREITNQTPLRSGKGTAWEGGMRVPMILRWDPAGAGGRVFAQPVQHVDLVPTILELVGAPPPASPLDGQSLVPVIEGADTLERDVVFFHFPAYLDYIEEGIEDRLRESPTSAVWNDRHKLIWRYETASWELYDLDTDLGETTNIASTHPDLVADLGQRLVDWLVETDAALPVEKGTSVQVGLPDPQGGL